MGDWWMQSGTTSTAEGANQPAMVGHAVVTQSELASCAVGNAELALGSVTSEKASTNLVTRSITVIAGSTSGTGFASTALALFTAPVPLTITGIKVAPMTEWTVATCGSSVIEIWSCTAGSISRYCATSTEVLKTVGEVNSCFTLSSSAVTLAACETVRLKVAIPGTTSCAQIAAWQIDYLTSG